MVGLVTGFTVFVAIYYLVRKYSLGIGVLFVMAVGYVYGIYRAHFLDSLSYFLFDVAIIGLYAGCIPYFRKPPLTPNAQHLKNWTRLLVFWPFILLLIPVQDYLIQAVGFRGNAFLVLMLLIGSQLTSDDSYDIGVGLAVLNLFALSLAVAELIFGIERFIPYSAVTDLIYRSHDVGSTGAYRIPSSFVNAHAYGGTMVASLPMIIGAWSAPQKEPWHRPVLLAGSFAAGLGVFVSAARVHFVILAIVAMVLMLSIRLRPTQRLACLLVVCATAYVVSGHERLQRFTTLDDEQMVEGRVHSSLNSSFWDALTEYPFGNGIGGGGTSIPFFLIERWHPPTILLENEFGRIQLELGIVGLGMWICFFLWAFTRPKPKPEEPFFAGRRLAWVVCGLYCGTAFIGTGLLTSIPFSALIVMMIGWVSAPNFSFKHRITPPMRAQFATPSIQPRAVGQRHLERTPS